MADLEPVPAPGPLSSSPLLQLNDVQAAMTSPAVPTVPGQGDVVLEDVFWAVSRTSSSPLPMSSSTVIVLPSAPTETAVSPSSSSTPAQTTTVSPPAGEDRLKILDVASSPSAVTQPVILQSKSSSTVFASSSPIATRRSDLHSSSTVDVILQGDPSASSSPQASRPSNSIRSSYSASRATVIVTETITSSPSSSNKSPAVIFPAPIATTTSMSKFFKPTLNHASGSPRDDFNASTLGVANGIQNAVLHDGDPASTSGSDSNLVTTYVTDGTTLSGSAAMAALAAMTSTSSGTKNAGAADAKDGIGTKDGGSRLSSFAIVGIVTGVLVFFIILYIVWYQWRKKRVKSALGGNQEDEKGVRSNDHIDYEDDRKTQRSSFGNDPFLDKPTGFSEPTWYKDDDRQSAYDRRGDQAHDNRYRNSQDERDEYEEGLEYLEEEYQRDTAEDPEYEGGLTAAYLSHEHGDEAYEVVDSPHRMSIPLRVSQDPFKPPAPVPRSVSSVSAQFDLASRPLTKVSRVDSYAYASIYDGYDRTNDHSRRATTYEPDPTTPATSTLLPWLSDQADPPPMPKVLPAAKGKSGLKHHYEIAENVRRPGPPVAAMAQTPAVQGGWSGMIPPFR